MARYGRGLVCTALTTARIEELRLPMMVQSNTSRFETAFTVSVEAREGTTTVISAAERALTSRRLADPKYQAEDFVTPGHTFPLKSRDGGVLVRAGHTEAAVDLARMAGRDPSGVICEIMREDGTMARRDDLMVVAKEHGLKIITIEDLIAYRHRTETLVSRIAAPRMPTEFGEFQAFAYLDQLSGAEHIALVRGEIKAGEVVTVRVHSECLTGDVFHSMRCDCGQQLEAAMRQISEVGGVLLYMRNHEGRGIGLANKMRAYALQDEGLDTVEANHKLGFKADQRSYGIGVQILADLGLSKIRLLTNNPHKISGLKGFGLEVVEVAPLEIEANHENRRYLGTKKTKFGHHLQQNLD
jgi:3,4-dihydroxy 2-butanone 4-phosphate synthase/GTP cyclohydrolase II